MRLLYSPLASLELVEARRWYDERREGLGEEFQRSFESAAAAILAHPERYAVLFKTRRRVFIRRFPYFLLYEVVGDVVLVVGCIHCARDPSTWKRGAA